MMANQSSIVQDFETSLDQTVYKVESKRVSGEYMHAFEYITGIFNIHLATFYLFNE